MQTVPLYFSQLLLRHLFCFLFFTSQSINDEPKPREALKRHLNTFDSDNTLSLRTLHTQKLNAQTTVQQLLLSNVSLKSSVAKCNETIGREPISSVFKNNNKNTDVSKSRLRKAMTAGMTKDKSGSRHSLSQCIKLISNHKSSTTSQKLGIKILGNRNVHQQSHSEPLCTPKINYLCTKFQVYQDETTSSISVFKVPSSTNVTPPDGKMGNMKDITNQTTPKMVPVKHGNKSKIIQAKCSKSFTSKNAVLVTPVNSTVTTQFVNSSFKQTPPMCECGRRSTRKLVQTPGPNVGRFFFACPLGHRGHGKKSGCGFFKWDGMQMNNQDKYKSYIQSPLQQPNFNTPNSGNFSVTGNKQNVGMTRGAMLKPPAF